ncbi:MAG: 3'-5' exonuclease [Actinobacteria bacterium]|nr:3'-5' exonuclease [Actinomycetota bacterium]
MSSCYVSVDLETSGPHPGTHSVLAIGACVVDDPATGFYAELRPERDGVDGAAVAVSGLSLDRLRAEGEPPHQAWRRFAGWAETVAPEGSVPVFVGFNAPFDWMFAADGLHRHAGRNPFGHSALDVKALAMGADGLRWEETSFAALAARHGLPDVLPHHALEDARLQADLFRRILARLAEREASP